MINIYILCPRSLNNCVENLKIQINQYLDTQNNRTKSINRINSSGQLVAILQKFCRVKFQFIVVCVTALQGQISVYSCLCDGVAGDSAQACPQAFLVDCYQAAGTHY